MPRKLSVSVSRQDTWSLAARTSPITVRLSRCQYAKERQTSPPFSDCHRLPDHHSGHLGHLLDRCQKQGCHTACRCRGCRCRHRQDGRRPAPDQCTGYCRFNLHRHSPQPGDGELVRLHFREGQQVKAGQLLAELDPRPFKAELMQAEGQLMRDKALLENARLDLKALPAAAGTEFDRQTAGRYASIPGQTVRRYRQARPGECRQRPPPARIQPDHGSDFRTRRPAAGRSGQHRPRQRYERHRHHHAGTTDQCLLFHPGSRSDASTQGLPDQSQSGCFGLGP